MLRGAVGATVLAYLFALFVLHGLEASENDEERLPDRASRTTVPKDNLLFSPVDSYYTRNARLVQRRQEALLLQEELNAELLTRR